MERLQYLKSLVIMNLQLQEVPQPIVAELVLRMVVEMLAYLLLVK